MTEIKYTHSVDLDSWVESAWYNANTSELFVNLEGSVYVYQGVPKSTYDGLVQTDNDGDSVGGYYNGEIKRGGFGEAEYLDDAYYVTAHYVSPPPSAAAGMPKGLSTSSQSRTATYDLPKPATVNPPTALDAVIDTSKAATFNLRASQPVLPRYDVTFEVNGNETSHLVTAESVVEAVNQLVNLFNAVGVADEIVITGVNLRRG